MQRLWSRIINIVAAVGLAGIVWTAGIWYQYQANLPRQPEPTLGPIYPLNVHGIVVVVHTWKESSGEEIQPYPWIVHCCSETGTGLVFLPDHGVLVVLCVAISSIRICGSTLRRGLCGDAFTRQAPGQHRVELIDTVLAPLRLLRSWEL